MVVLSLTNSNFSGSFLEYIDFTGVSSMSGTKFIGISGHNMILTGTNMSNSDFTLAKINNVDFRETLLIGNTNFTNAELKNTNLCGQDLRFATLIGTDFDKAFLPDVNLSYQQTLNGTKFTEANLTNANVLDLSLRIRPAERNKNLNSQPAEDGCFVYRFEI